MKKYIKEIVILLLQLLMFYIFPLFCGPTDVIAMVLLVFASVLIFSFILGMISKEKVKCLYPITVVILFAPTLFIYYDISAAIYLIWHLVVSSVGLAVGMGIRFIFQRINR